jgi:ABC-type multidrug transport system ATPase subunit
MKIDHLWIHEFKNLKNFKVDLSDNHRISAIVGINGSGKSNLFESLCAIFSSLDNSKPNSIQAPPFKYEIAYKIRNKAILIKADPTNTKSRYTFFVNEKPCTNNEFFENLEAYLPNHIFAYYSGESKRLEKYFSKSQKRFDEELRKGTDSPLRRMFLARPIHGYFVLLSFFLDKRDNSLQQLIQSSDYLSITELESVLFVLKTPHWLQSQNKDNYFWGARGKVKDFLESLWAYALAPIKASGKATLVRTSGLVKEENVEKIFLYLKDIKTFHRLVAEDSPQDFFKKLESTYIADLLDYVDVRVTLANCDDPLTYRELSEGEQQLLAVLGLLKFTQEEESLFLLDEPDTHLNPNWSRNYISLLRNVMGDENQSQILISSHDPVVLSELNKEQVVLLDKNSDGKIIQTELEENIKGKGYGGVLIGRLFDLPSQLDTETHDKVMEYYRLLSLKKADDINDQQSQDLKKLKSELDNIGYWLEHSDPLFSEYLKARHDFWQDLDDTTETNLKRSKALEVITKVYGG